MSWLVALNAGGRFLAAIFAVILSSSSAAGVSGCDVRCAGSRSKFALWWDILRACDFAGVRKTREKVGREEHPCEL